MKKSNDAGTYPVLEKADAFRHFFGPVPDRNYGCQNVAAGVSFLDADAPAIVTDTYLLFWLTCIN
jgi:hypothetical protein